MTIVQTICDFIILIGAVVLAVTRIAEFFGKPLSFFNKKKEQVETERLQKILAELIPKYITEDGDKRFAAFSEEMKQSIHDQIDEQFKSIKANSIKQDETVEAIRVGMMNILRQRIMDIYERGEETRTISRTEKEVVDELFEDYTSLNGNSYIIKYYNRICDDWEVIPDSYDPV